MMKKSILFGKNCFLTGATGGLGREIAISLAKNNCNLFLTATNPKKLLKLQKDLLKINPSIMVFYKVGDLSKLSNIKNLIDFSMKKFPSIDILINCAGIFPVKSLQSSTINDFDTCFAINVRAPFILSKEFSKNMNQKKWGRIINIASSSAYSGFKDTSIYCASKHALLGFSRSLFQEFKNKNVRTICISPGSIKTQMGKKVRNQNYDTFIDPTDLSQLIIEALSHNKEMIVEELRVNRTEIQ